MTFDFHIVVDPHHPSLCTDPQSSAGTGKLIAVKVCCQVKLPVLLPVMMPEFSRSVKWHKAADSRGRGELMHRQLFRQAAREKTALLKEKQCHVHPVIVQIPQEVKQALLDAACRQVILEKGNPLFHASP